MARRPCSELKASAQCVSTVHLPSTSPVHTGLVWTGGLWASTYAPPMYTYTTTRHPVVHTSDGSGVLMSRHNHVSQSSKGRLSTALSTDDTHRLARTRGSWKRSGRTLSASPRSPTAPRSSFDMEPLAPAPSLSARLRSALHALCRPPQLTTHGPIRCLAPVLITRGPSHLWAA